MLLFACLGGGLAVCLRADELSTLPATTAVEAAPRVRALDETELLKLLTPALQQDYVGQKGELELRLTRAWATINVPDEPLTVKILELPNAGVTPSFVLRFELRTAEKSLGNWQVPLRAQVWREIWVAHSALRQGDLLADADVARERRDVLAQRSALAEFEAGDLKFELAESLQAGSPLLARSVRVRPVVRKGQMADAVVQDGTLSVSLKVQVLEDGAPGQIVRARNPQSRRDVTGRVVDERTLMISL